MSANAPNNHPNRNQRRNRPSDRWTGCPEPHEVRSLREGLGLTRFQAALLVHATEAGWGNWERERSDKQARPMSPATWELFRLKARTLTTRERLEVLIDNAAPPRCYVRITDGHLVLHNPTHQAVAHVPLPLQFALLIQQEGCSTT
jgi:DNA-binding transcriptional regulator YiaG